MPPTQEEMVRADEKARAEEKSRVETHAAATGAQAVADAVKRVADAAVAEASKATVIPAYDFKTTGTKGGFQIRGSGFTASGTVLFAGKAAETTAWGNEHIEGKTPDGFKEGEVIVRIDEKTQQRGYLKVA